MFGKKVINPQGIGYEGEKIHPTATRICDGYEVRLTVEEERSKRHNKSLPLIRALNSYVNKEIFKNQKIIDDKVKEYKKKGGNRRIIYKINDKNYYSESDEYKDNYEELNKIYDEVQMLDNTKLDFKPKNKAELIKLIERIIQDVNEINEEIFIWTESIDFEIYDRKLSGYSHKMINVRPNDIKELNKFETNLKISNILMDVFKEHLISQNISIKNLVREQWVYLLAKWFKEKSNAKSQLGKWYLPFTDKEYNYDYLINYYEITVEDILNMIQFINELDKDFENTKSVEIIHEIEKTLKQKGISERDYDSLDYDDWVDKINDYVTTFNIDLDETYVFRPTKCKSEIMEHSINYYQITTEDLNDSGYDSDPFDLLIDNKSEDSFLFYEDDNEKDVESIFSKKMKI